MSNTTPNTKQQLRIKELLAALLLMNQRDPDGIDEYVDFCIRDLEQLITDAVAKALAEVKDVPSGSSTFGA